LTHIGEFGSGMELLCFWNNNYQVYQNPNWNTCEYAIISGIERESALKNFFIYPNPTNDFLEIKSDIRIKEVSVIDIYGRRLIYQDERVINMSNLPNGIYFISVMYDKQIFTEKIVKY